MIMSETVDTSYAEELNTLSAEVLRMGGLVESMIMAACNAVAIGDIEQGKAIVQRDLEVDALEAEIEQRITRIIASHQPLAQDLREILSALKIASDLERVGDLSKSIAKRVEFLAQGNSAAILKGMPRMGRAVSTQIASVLDAYTNRDAEVALRVWEGDEEIDQIYNSYFREVLTYMMEDPRTIGASAHILFMAKNLERIGDHATNIAELVYFSATGTPLDAGARPKIENK